MYDKINAKELKKILIDKEVKSLKQLSDLTGLSIGKLWRLLNKDISESLRTAQILTDYLEIEPLTAYNIFLKTEKGL